MYVGFILVYMLPFFACMYFGEKRRQRKEAEMEEKWEEVKATNKEVWERKKEEGGEEEGEGREKQERARASS